MHQICVPNGPVLGQSLFCRPKGCSLQVSQWLEPAQGQPVELTGTHKTLREPNGTAISSATQQELLSTDF